MENKAYKILFLDDDQFIREMYSVKFSQTNHEVQFAASAEEALQILKEGFVPDALVFDVIMPGMQGFDFLEEAYKQKLIDRNKTVIIALTNQSEKSDYDRARSLLVDEYIVKANYIPSEVVSLIESVIEKFKSNYKDAFNSDDSDKDDTDLNNETEEEVSESEIEPSDDFDDELDVFDDEEEWEDEEFVDDLEDDFDLEESEELDSESETSENNKKHKLFGLWN